MFVFSQKKSPSRYQSRVPAARAAAVIGHAIGSWVSPADAEIPAMLAAVLEPTTTDGGPWCHAPTCLQHAVVVGQLVSRLALQMSRLEDLQAQCVLWVEFVRVLRDQWRTQQLLPHMGLGRDGMLNPVEVDPLDGISMPTPDFHFNLLHQKLQLLNLRVRLPLSRRHSHATDDDDEFFDSLEELPCVGVLRSVEGHRLLHHPTKELHVPVTQDAVPLTEDIAKEQQDILAKCAANPLSCLADFIRWYSPRDWSECDGEIVVDMQTTFPQGHLSARMSHHQDANPWQLMWMSAAAVPADKQKPLFDAPTEAEKLFHYLETMAPATLLYHMVVATLSNASVFWQVAMGHEWLEAFPVFVSVRDHFQAKCNKAIAALDDAAVDELRQPTAEHQVLEALALDACDKAVDALAQVETTVAALTSLRHVLPQVSATLVNDMVVTKGPVVVAAEDRAAVTDVVWTAKDPSGPLHRFPVEREYVLRHTAPRPFFVGPRDGGGRRSVDVVNRLYANFTPHEVRYALVLTDSEF
ncbi:hypothetical protein DYB30_006403 [Aphanomyces astaci]|uniref:Rab3 GTPase-activating protein catalytic subunit n=1 Tax=Aphanomyces astaci TaxID=112090 RepID=A0A397DN28_APHAT|nr:hypothetical protein DYB30_006403 [Aphanomyces astaci]